MVLIEVKNIPPIVFFEWWFWLGLILILLFFKLVVFKKK